MNVLKADNLCIVLHFRYRATHVDTGGIDGGGGGAEWNEWRALDQNREGLKAR